MVADFREAASMANGKQSKIRDAFLRQRHGAQKGQGRSPHRKLCLALEKIISPILSIAEDGGAHG